MEERAEFHKPMGTTDVVVVVERQGRVAQITTTHYETASFEQVATDTRTVEFSKVANVVNALIKLGYEQVG